LVGGYLVNIATEESKTQDLESNGKYISKSTSLFSNMPSKLQPILEVVSVCAVWGRMTAISARRQSVQKQHTTSQNLTH
jgi:hypothetical protein